MGQIVAGVDGSDGGARALRWAVEEGRASGRSVVAAMTWGFVDQRHAEGTGFTSLYGESDATRALEVFIDAAVGPDDEGGIERRVINDLPAAGLLAASADADVLAVGSRGLGGFRGLLLGSVSRTCLRHATCPVAVVREREEGRAQPIRHIVIGVDGSDNGRAALDWGLDEARRIGAVVVAVHAWPLPFIGSAPVAIPIDPTPVAGAARDLLDRIVADADTTGLSEPVRKVVVEGSAPGALLDAAEHAELIVVGARGRSGWDTVVLGSVSSQTVHHATCPVIVVPSPSS